MNGELTDLGRSEIEDLERDGIKLTPDEVVRIAYLADHVTTPSVRRELARGRPVPCGGSYLWPLTLYAANWFERVGERLGGTTTQTRALAYAMAHVREDMPECDQDAKKAVLEWYDSIKATNSEIEEAVREVLMQESGIQKTSESKKATFGEVSLAMAKHIQADPELWERQMSMEYVVSFLETVSAQARAENKTADPKVKALRALGLYVMSIRKARQDEA